MIRRRHAWIPRRESPAAKVRDEDCDPSLGQYLVGVYERVDE